MKIGIAMGSTSDMKYMVEACNMLSLLGIEYETMVVSAHRTPLFMYEYAKEAGKKFFAIIAGAGGAAALPGMLAALTDIPVLGVPIPTEINLDSILSILEMPLGTPLATFGLGKKGAGNAALFIARMMAPYYPEIKQALEKYKIEQIAKVMES
jgi:5-(carboxyamino)imidazole ribonucleotide mutase